MQNSKTIVGVIVFLVIIAGVVMWRQGRKGADGEVPLPTTTTPEQSLPVTLNVKHLYKDGTHTYRGSVETPTPCYDVTATSTPTLGGEFSVLIASKDRGGICAQVVADKDFQVRFQAAKDVTVYPQFNGKPAMFNIIEVSREEDLLGPFDFKS